MAKRKAKAKVAKQDESPAAMTTTQEPSPAAVSDTPRSAASLTTAAEPSRPHAVDFNTPRSVAHDNQVGVRLLKFEKFKQLQLQVPEDAPAEIFQQLRDKGWTYRADEKVFTKQYGDQGAGPTYVEARRLYQELCQQLSPAGQSIPF